MGRGGIGFEMGYLKSIPGALKIFELLFDFMALILSAAAPIIDGYSGNRGFFIFVTVLALIVTVLLFIIMLFKINESCLSQWWGNVELVWCMFIALFYFIGSIVIAVVGPYAGIYGAAAFFGFAAFLTYLGDGLNRLRLRLTGQDAPNRATNYAANSQ